MAKLKIKRAVSFLMATILSLTAFMGVGANTAFAAAGEKTNVYMVDFPRDGDANYDGVWGHNNLTLKNGWHTGSATHTNLKAIARPYVGKKKGEFKRTSNRHDYALKPTGATALNALKDAGLDVIGVGKIHDIFCGEGITETHHSNSSVHGMEQTIELCKKDFRGLCFVNLVDFDALWGHRRDVEGYAKEIEKFDKNLGILLDELREDDLLMLTADHGNDPTYTGTDHTREYVPLIAYSRKMEGGGALENEDTFAVIGASVAENFGVNMPEGTIGQSILKKLV